MLFLLGERVCICRLAEVANHKNKWVRKSQICKSQKIYSPQIANPQIATFSEGPQILEKFKSANLLI